LLLAVFFLTSALPTAVAAGPRKPLPTARATRPAAGAVSTADLLSLFLPPWAANLFGRWGKEGCSIDPSGLCGKGGAAPIGGYAGCSIDPDGCPGAPSSLENGCSIDPSG